MSVAQLDTEALLTSEEESQVVVIWRRFRKHRLAVASTIIIVVMILTAVLIPIFSVYAYTDQTPASQNLGPNSTNREGGYHLLGTDELGRDLATRLMYAGRISLTVGFTVALLETLIGTLIGAISGYFGGWVDIAAMRLVDLILTLPSLPLLLVLSTILRGVTIPGIPREWTSVIVIIVILSALGWTNAARLVRGTVLSLREQEFTEASRALGVSDFTIIFRHMIPNAMAPVIVAATLSVGTAIIIESALSFLGFGIQPPVPTWGNMLANARTDMFINPGKALYPGVLIFLAVLSFNFIGDGLRDALDPRLKE